MKKLIVILFTLLFCTTAFAGGITDKHKAVIAIKNIAAASDYCSSCTPGDPTDVLCEDFEGVGEDLRCAWTDVIDDGGTINHDLALGANWACTNIGDEVLEVDVTDTTAADLIYTYYDHGSGLTNWRVKFWFIVRTEDLTNNEYGGIFNLSITNPSTLGGLQLLIFDSDGQLQLCPGCDNTAPACVNIAINTQYEIYASWVSSGTSIIELDGVGICSDATSAEASPQYLTLGKYRVISDVSFKIEYGGIVVDDDTEPSNCTE